MFLPFCQVIFQYFRILRVTDFNETYETFCRSDPILFAQRFPCALQQHSGSIFFHKQQKGRPKAAFLNSSCQQTFHRLLNRIPSFKLEYNNVPIHLSVITIEQHFIFRRPERQFLPQRIGVCSLNFQERLGIAVVYL